MTAQPAVATGGEGAPDLQESLQNFGINLTAVLILGFLVYRDIQVLGAGSVKHVRHAQYTAPAWALGRSMCAQGWW
jgi:hypothetical protein